MSSYLERIVRFVEVARESSITRAAANMGVDQPWLSRQIAQLEEVLGFSLLIRTPRGVKLTAEGEAFLKSATLLADAAKLIKADTERLRRGQTGLVMGVPYYAYWVPSRQTLTDRFERLNPGVSFTIVPATVQTIPAAILSGQIDVGLIAVPPAGPTFDFVGLHRSAPGMIIPREDPLADKPELRVADFKGRTLAVVEKSELGKSLYGAFLEAGMRTRTVMEGRAAMSHYAELERLCVLTLSNVMPEIIVPENMVFRQVADAPNTVTLGLLKAAGDTRPAVQQLWSIATKLSPPHFSSPDTRPDESACLAV